jgi:hypothetical protein
VQSSGLIGQSKQMAILGQDKTLESIQENLIDDVLISSTDQSGTHQRVDALDASIGQLQSSPKQVDLYTEEPIKVESSSIASSFFLSLTSCLRSRMSLRLQLRFMTNPRIPLSKILVSNQNIGTSYVDTRFATAPKSLLVYYTITDRSASAWIPL